MTEAPFGFQDLLELAEFGGVCVSTTQHLRMWRTLFWDFISENPIEIASCLWVLRLENQ